MACLSRVWQDAFSLRTQRSRDPFLPCSGTLGGWGQQEVGDTMGWVCTGMMGVSCSVPKAQGSGIFYSQKLKRGQAMGGPGGKGGPWAIYFPELTKSKWGDTLAPEYVFLMFLSEKQFNTFAQKCLCVLTYASPFGNLA